MSAPAAHHYTSTGLDSRKIAIWAFIGSECMLFVSLISTYLLYKGRRVVGPVPSRSMGEPVRRDLQAHPQHSCHFSVDIRAADVVVVHGAGACCRSEQE